MKTKPQHIPYFINKLYVRAQWKYGIQTAYNVDMNSINYNVDMNSRNCQGNITNRGRKQKSNKKNAGNISLVSKSQDILMTQAMFLILEKCYTNVTKQRKKRALCVYRLFNIN